MAAAAPPPALLAPTSAGRQPLRSAHHRRGRRLSSVPQPRRSAPYHDRAPYPGSAPSRPGAPSPAQPCPAPLTPPRRFRPAPLPAAPPRPSDLSDWLPALPITAALPTGDGRGNRAAVPPPAPRGLVCSTRPPAASSGLCHVHRAAVPERPELREWVDGNVREWKRCRLRRSCCSHCATQHGLCPQTPPLGAARGEQSPGESHRAVPRVNCDMAETPEGTSITQNDVIEVFNCLLNSYFRVLEVPCKSC